MKAIGGTLGAVLAGIFLTGAVASAAISQAERASARKVVEGTFGEQIRQVRASLAKEDDLKTAERLLQASQDRKQRRAVQAELARAAMELADSAGTPEAAALAEQALGRWSGLVGISKTERAEWLVRIRTSPLARAEADRKQQLAAGAVDAVVELAAAYEDEGDYERAAAAIVRALGMARAARLAGAVADLEERNARIQHLRLFHRDLAEAKQRLAAAIAGKNPPRIRELQEKIGMLHLLHNGDPAAASAHLAKAGHEWAKAADDLRRRPSGKGLPPEQALAAVDMLLAAAVRAHPQAKRPLLKQLLTVCGNVGTKTAPDDDQARRLNALQQRAQAMLDKLSPEKPPSLQEALASLAGAVSLSPDGNAQVVYSFDQPGQLADWDARRGQWQADKGRLTQQASTGGRIYHRVRFRADRPMEIRFAATGRGIIAATLALNDKLDQPDGSVRFLLDQHRGSGWMMGGLGARRLAGPIPQGTRQYDAEVLHDGTGEFTWIVNGQTLGKISLRKSLVAGHFRLGLILDGQRRTAFSALTIKGTPWPRGRSRSRVRRPSSPRAISNAADRPAASTDSPKGLGQPLQQVRGDHRDLT